MHRSEERKNMRQTYLGILYDTQGIKKSQRCYLFVSIILVLYNNPNLFLSTISPKTRNYYNLNKGYFKFFHCKTMIK